MVDRRMSLSSEYQEQARWRGLPDIFDMLGPLEGRTVLDLGCAVGDQAAELVQRKARVIGVDANDELLRVARARRLANAEFRTGDLRTLGDIGVVADGIWCSFVAAYFPDLAAMLQSWRRQVRPGGFVALTEVDGLFGHEPLGAETKRFLEGYAQEALARGRYDFHMGRKLQGHVLAAGFTIVRVVVLEDQELAFQGPADPAVIRAWNSRFVRMKLLAEFCGDRFDHVRNEFLSCLSRLDHRATAKVYCCVATK
jgi:SAM-dependent methyltransferase